MEQSDIHVYVLSSIRSLMILFKFVDSEDIGKQINISD